MNNGFWGKLARPIVGLSPMDGVTDAPMRFISKKYGQPDVIYTEFVSVEGLWRIHKRGETTSKIWRDLRFDPSEKPVVAQLFGSDPDSFYEATKIVAKMGFDGIDINMGCPSPGLEKRGGGAGLMRDFGLAHRVIEAVRKGVDDCFLDSNLAKCSAHAYLSRPDEVGTRMDMLCADLVGPSAPISTRSLIVGDGDLEAKVSLDPFDGGLIGRAAIGNHCALRKDGYLPNVEEKLRVAVEHAREFEKNLPGNKFEPMRKHLTWYAHGFDGAGGLRRKLVQTNSADEVEEVVENFRKNC